MKFYQIKPKHDLLMKRARLFGHDMIVSAASGCLCQHHKLFFSEAILSSATMREGAGHDLEENVNSPTSIN